jgi:hypothetical protein
VLSIDSQTPEEALESLRRKKRSLTSQKGFINKQQKGLNPFERKQKVDAMQARIKVIDGLIKQKEAEIKGGENGAS